MIASASSQASAARAALTLGTMPPAMVPSAIRASASSALIESSLRAVGVAHAVDVGHQHELSGAEAGGDARPPRRRR